MTMRRVRNQIQQSHQYAQKRAFTIVEMIMVTAMLVIIGVSLASVFKRVIDSYVQVRSLGRFMAISQNVFMSMTRDIRNAYVSKTDNRFRFIGNIDEINCHALVETSAGATEMQEIGYARNGTQLERRVDTSNIPNADVTSGGATEALADNIVNIGIAYYYRTASGSFEYHQGLWDSHANNVANYDYRGVAKNPDGLPEAVEITLTVRDEHGHYTDQTQTTMIFVPQDKYF